MANAKAPEISPFLHRRDRAPAHSLAILHLKRDLQNAIVLRDSDDTGEGYFEGKVTNNRFGSFPHSTLIGAEWGSQIRASAVDTGSRGRGRKRKRAPAGEEESFKTATSASTGFVHLLPPTPEFWTTSLPHRTQVVYTPDYSYVLQRLCVRPGDTLIEAGTGSGSFTHAAARAVYSGHGEPGERGHVYTYEFHQQRVEKIGAELASHGLLPLVTATHRDVCADGFLNPSDGGKVQATAVFLDLPAPWLALPHLSRRSADHPLDPTGPVHICCFNPCIEQVSRTVTALREFGWVEVGMVELDAKRLIVRRERVGLQEEGVRGAIAWPATVEEAVERLKYEEKRRETLFPPHSIESILGPPEDSDTAERAERSQPEAETMETDTPTSQELITRQERLSRIQDAQKERELWKEGRLVHRSEAEIKTHTSYLVFAVLPPEWTEEDEKRAAEANPVGALQADKGKSKKQLKRERRAAKAAAQQE